MKIGVFISLVCLLFSTSIVQSEERAKIEITDYEVDDSSICEIEDILIRTNQIIVQLKHKTELDYDEKKIESECEGSFDFKLNRGHKLRIKKIKYYGEYELSEGTEAVVRTTYKYLGERTKSDKERYKGEEREDFDISAKPEEKDYSDCGESETVSFKSQHRISRSDSTDEENSIKVDRDKSIVFEIKYGDCDTSNMGNRRRGNRINVIGNNRDGCDCPGPMCDDGTLHDEDKITEFFDFRIDSLDNSENSAKRRTGGGKARKKNGKKRKAKKGNNRRGNRKKKKMGSKNKRKKKKHHKKGNCKHRGTIKFQNNEWINDNGVKLPQPQINLD